MPWRTPNCRKNIAVITSSTLETSTDELQKSGKTTEPCETTTSLLTTTTLKLQSTTVPYKTTTLQRQASAVPYNPCEEHYVHYVTSLASPGPTRYQEVTMPELSPLSSISQVSHTTAHPESNVPETSSLLDKKASFSQFVEDLIANSDNCEEKDDKDNEEEEEPQPINCNFF